MTQLPSRKKSLQHRARLAVELLEDRLVPASLKVSDLTFVEGHAGAGNAEVMVTLSSPSNKTVTVNYSTANGTASAGIDYNAVSGKLTFAPGQTSLTIKVPVIGDRLSESNETFFANLRGAKNATIDDGQGIVTIQDDDSRRLSINDVSGLEWNTGTSPLTFTVSLSPACDMPVTVNFATQDGTPLVWPVYQVAALGGQDYRPANGMLTFAAGETSKLITVDIFGDTRPEEDQRFFVNLSGATNALIADGQGVGIILDDESSLATRTAIWDGGGGDFNWSNPSNWMNDRLPHPKDDVVVGGSFAGITISHGSGTTSVRSLDSFANINVSGGSFILNAAGVTSRLWRDLTVSGGELIGTGVLTVDGPFTWSGGTLRGGGRTHANRTVTITGNADKFLTQHTLRLGESGTHIWNGLGRIGVGGGGAIDNWGRFDPQADTRFFNAFGGAVPTFTNHNQFFKRSDTGTTTFDYMAFTNNGWLSVGAGSTLNLAAGFTNFSSATSTLTGRYYHIEVWGTLQFPGANVVTNEAALSLNGPASRIVNEAGADALAGFARNNGWFAISGRNFAMAREFTNNGMLRVEEGTLNLAAGLTNFSSATSTLTGGSYEVSGTLQFPGANIITNAAGIYLHGPASRIVDEAGNNALADFARNEGSFNFHGRNFATAYAFTNTGSLFVGSGSTLTVNGDYTQTAGSTLGIGVEWDGRGQALVQVAGAAQLAGTLLIDAGWTEPLAEMTYEVLKFGSCSGGFTDSLFYYAGQATIDFGYLYNAGSLTLWARSSPPPPDDPPPEDPPPPNPTATP